MFTEDLGNVVINAESAELVVGENRCLNSTGSVSYIWAKTVAIKRCELLEMVESFVDNCRCIYRDSTSLRPGDIILYDNAPALVASVDSSLPELVLLDGTVAENTATESGIILQREQLLMLLNRLYHKRGNLNKDIEVHLCDLNGLCLLKGDVKSWEN